MAELRPRKIIVFWALIPLLAGAFGPVLAADGHTPGSIYLQVEQNGEAWYVHPVSAERFYLGRPEDAWALLRSQAVGISNADLKKIPIGVLAFGALDTDQDKLGDRLEDSLGTNRLLRDTDQDGLDDYHEAVNGYNPLGSGVMPVNIAFARRYAGYIFIQAEARGEAWYLNPSDLKRYYLGQKEDAFAVMRALGIGIDDAGLARIAISRLSAALPPRSIHSDETGENGADLRQLEFLIAELVNHERLKAGRPALAWNSDLARVARLHSENLAAENQGFTGLGKACDFPIIHHEGPVFGPYNSDRLKASGAHYYEKSGENIALVSAGAFIIRFASDDPAASELGNCAAVRSAQEKAYLAKLDAAADAASKIGVIRQELSERAALYRGYSEVEISRSDWHSGSELARETVNGWMESLGHKENILNQAYDEAGVGAVYVNGYVISTQVFIKRAVCGYQGGPCCEEPGYRPYCYIPLSCEADKVCRE